MNFKEYYILKESGENSLADVENTLNGLGVDYSIYEKNGIITVSKIKIAPVDQGKGLGTMVMNILTEYADKTRQTIILTPSVDFGASSVNRLKAFYKRFGFVENSGRNKDFRFRETMYRPPAKYLK